MAVYEARRRSRSVQQTRKRVLCTVHFRKRKTQQQTAQHLAAAREVLGVMCSGFSVNKDDLEEGCLFYASRHERFSDITIFANVALHNLLPKTQKKNIFLGKKNTSMGQHVEKSFPGV